MDLRRMTLVLGELTSYLVELGGLEEKLKGKYWKVNKELGGKNPARLLINYRGYISKVESKGDIKIAGSCSSFGHILGTFLSNQGMINVDMFKSFLPSSSLSIGDSHLVYIQGKIYIDPRKIKSVKEYKINLGNIEMFNSSEEREKEA